MAPELPQIPPPLNPALGGNQTATNAPTPKRTGDGLGAPSPRRVRSSSQLGQLAGDNELSARHHNIPWDRVGAFSVDDEDFQQIIRSPGTGWPAYDILRETDGAGPRLGHKIFDGALSRGLQADLPFIRGLGVDHFSVVSDFCGRRACSLSRIQNDG